MTRRTHDADLCDRIKELEEKVAELERDLEVHRASAPHGGWWQAVPYTVPYTPPWPTWQPYTWPYITTSGTVTTGDVVVGSNVRWDQGTNYTLTENSNA